MLHVIRVVGLIGCILALWMAPPAALAGPLEDCQSLKNLDLEIRACTELIRRGKSKVAAYHFRGRAYADKGDHDAAIADYNEGIRLTYPGDVFYPYTL